MDGRRNRFLLSIFSCTLTASMWAAKPPASSTEASVETSKFGTLSNGTAVDLYTIKNKKGTTAKIATYGATLTELWVPDRSGNLADIVLGYDKVDGYVGKTPWFGATVGRVANRIAKGKFTLDGKEYSLEINDPPNSLHSGLSDLSHVVWKAEAVHERNGAAVRFTYNTPDGDEGFPGNLLVTVLYRLTDDNELHIEYTGKSDKPTPVNMTNHSYFNLSGKPDVLDQVLELNADSYTPTDATLIPTGEIKPVKGTPLDFTRPVAIGAHIAEMVGNPGGYDHNFVVNGETGKLKMAARAYDPTSGRQMEVWTTEPGVQFYSGNFLDGTLTGKRGVVYGKHSGFCLETQHFPDSVNQPKFPSTILRPPALYSTQTILKFSKR
jgi:aldose 1-epimerase